MINPTKMKNIYKYNFAFKIYPARFGSEEIHKRKRLSQRTKPNSSSIFLPSPCVHANDVSKSPDNFCTLLAKINVLIPSILHGFISDIIRKNLIRKLRRKIKRIGILYYLVWYSWLINFYETLNVSHSCRLTYVNFYNIYNYYDRILSK